MPPLYLVDFDFWQGKEMPFVENWLTCTLLTFPALLPIELLGNISAARQNNSKLHSPIRSWADATSDAAAVRAAPGMPESCRWERSQAAALPINHSALALPTAQPPCRNATWAAPERKTGYG